MQNKIVANQILVDEIGRLVNEGMQVTFVPKGSSMLPFIRGERDSVVLVKPENIMPMDIVLAKVGQTHVMHRVISIEGEKVTLMGDGNLYGVEYCRRNDITAKAIRIIKEDRQIDCTHKKHKRNALIWKKLLPLRRYLLAFYRRIY